MAQQQRQTTHYRGSAHAAAAAASPGKRKLGTPCRNTGYLGPAPQGHATAPHCMDGGGATTLSFGHQHRGVRPLQETSLHALSNVPADCIAITQEMDDSAVALSSPTPRKKRPSLSGALAPPDSFLATCDSDSDRIFTSSPHSSPPQPTGWGDSSSPVTSIKTHHPLTFASFPESLPVISTTKPLQSTFSLLRTTEDEGADKKSGFQTGTPATVIKKEKCQIGQQVALRPWRCEPTAAVDSFPSNHQHQQQDGVRGDAVTYSGRRLALFGGGSGVGVYSDVLWDSEDDEDERPPANCNGESADETASETFSDDGYDEQGGGYRMGCSMNVRLEGETMPYSPISPPTLLMPPPVCSSSAVSHKVRLQSASRLEDCSPESDFHHDCNMTIDHGEWTGIQFGAEADRTISFIRQRGWHAGDGGCDDLRCGGSLSVEAESSQNRSSGIPLDREESLNDDLLSSGTPERRNSSFASISGVSLSCSPIGNPGQETPSSGTPVGTPSSHRTPQHDGGTTSFPMTPERTPTWASPARPEWELRTASLSTGDYERRSSLQVSKVLMNKSGRVQVGAPAKGGCGPGVKSSSVSFWNDFWNLATIGEGNFAVVFKVKSKSDNELYAIKKSKRVFQSKQDRNEKMQEVLALQKLSACPYIVNFERAWQEDGYLYTQAELCELGNLKKVIERVLDSGSSFPDSSVWKVAHDVGEGLHFIHSHSFVHLDIKPSNVFICLSGRMKIGDFGMATAFGDRNGQEGDAAYMALELLNMQERKPSADIFSLGLTLYEMAVGLREVPVTGPLWHALREGAAPPLPMHRCTVLRDIIVAMMDRCEENRPSANFVRKEPCAAAAREADQFILDQGRAAAQKWGVLVGGGSCSAILEEDEQRFATTHQACGTPLRCGIRPETPVPPTPAPLAWSCSGRQQSK